MGFNALDLHHDVPYIAALHPMEDCSLSLHANVFDDPQDSLGANEPPEDCGQDQLHEHSGMIRCG